MRKSRVWKFRLYYGLILNLPTLSWSRFPRSKERENQKIIEHNGPSHLDLLDVKKNSNLCLTLKQKPDDMAQYFTFSQISISQKIHHPRDGRHMQPVHVNTYKSARNSNQFAKNLLPKRITTNKHNNWFEEIYFIM